MFGAFFPTDTVSTGLLHMYIPSYRTFNNPEIITALAIKIFVFCTFHQHLIMLSGGNTRRNAPHISASVPVVGNHSGVRTAIVVHQFDVHPFGEVIGPRNKVFGTGRPGNTVNRRLHHLYGSIGRAFYQPEIITAFGVKIFIFRTNHKHLVMTAGIQIGRNTPRISTAAAVVGNHSGVRTAIVIDELDIDPLM